MNLDFEKKKKNRMFRRVGKKKESEDKCESQKIAMIEYIYYTLCTESANYRIKQPYIQSSTEFPFPVLPHRHV